MSDGGLRRLFRQHLPQVHWTSIESRFSQSGIPDLHGCYDAVDFWIECKRAIGWRVKLRPFQVAWLLRRCYSGGRCFVAVRQTKTLYLYSGADAGLLARDGIKGCTALGLWHGGPSQWHWPAVLACLLGQAARGQGGPPVLRPGLAARQGMARAKAA